MAGISKMAAVWQNTEFDVFTFDYQWTIQNFMPVIQSTELETPPFKAPVTLKSRETRYTPVWKLSLNKVDPYNCKVTCSWCHGKVLRECHIGFGIEVAGGLDDILDESDSTDLWFNARVSILRPSTSSELPMTEKSIVCYIPSAGGDNHKLIPLQYKCQELKKNFLPFTSLHRHLVDGSLTLYAEFTVYVNIDTPKPKFVNKLLVAPQESLKEPDLDWCFSLNEARKNGLHTDITLVSDKKEFKAHKVVLATRSPFFKTRFEQRWEREDNKVEMSDVTPDTLDAILTFMYTGEIHSTDINQLALQVLPAAEEYQINGLKAQCEKAITAFLTDENVIEKLILAKKHKMEELKQICIMHIMKHPSEVRESEGWEKLQSSEEHRHLYLKVLEQLTELLHFKV